MAGGIRASIWTDAAQSLVMIFAMGALLYIGVSEVGGMQACFVSLQAVSPNYLDFLPRDLAFGPLPFIVGWIFGGVGVIGQPHIMTRFLALNDPQAFWKVRTYYYSWYTAFFTLAVGVGLIARLLIFNADSFDAELALPQMALQLLPDFFVGVVLAGLFAATMSTADSLVLSCTASLTHDFSSRWRGSYYGAKVATAVVTIVALCIALLVSDSVFVLVMIAWSSLASGYGPLLIVYCLGGRPSERVAILMVCVGVVTVLLWHNYGWPIYVYETMPGMLAGLAVYWVSLLSRKGSPRHRFSVATE